MLGLLPANACRRRDGRVLLLEDGATVGDKRAQRVRGSQRRAVAEQEGRTVSIIRLSCDATQGQDPSLQERFAGRLATEDLVEHGPNGCSRGRGQQLQALRRGVPNSVVILAAHDGLEKIIVKTHDVTLRSGRILGLIGIRGLEPPVLLTRLRLLLFPGGCDGTGSSLGSLTTSGCHLRFNLVFVLLIRVLLSIVALRHLCKHRGVPPTGARRSVDGWQSVRPRDNHRNYGRYCLNLLDGTVGEAPQNRHEGLDDVVGRICQQGLGHPLRKHVKRHGATELGRPRVTIATVSSPRDEILLDAQVWDLPCQLVPYVQNLL
mmetsp:Transcript_15606/g.44421  ORF Transcript_15606/g.44421 Transcript_15606/m.44421 type:complete len:319 (+) Transcript_15606:2875-3831(+)